MRMISLVAIGLFASSAGAGDLTAEQLSRAGFDCFNAGPSNWVHCTNFRQLGKPAVRVLVFSEDGGTFLGTEQLLRPDIYLRGSPPCPQDGADMWDFNEDVQYYACHHFDTGHH